MELSVAKFGPSLGFASSIGFLLRNLVFLAGGHHFTLSVMNAIYHDTDFKSIMTEGGFNFGRLLAGMGILFISGTFIGAFTAFLYNSLNAKKVA